GRCAPGKSPLVVDAAPSRSGKRAQLGDTSGTPLLGKADEVQEHLCGCFGVWKRTVARGRRNAEEGGKRGKADAPAPAFEQAAGKRGRTEGRFGETTTMQHKELSLEKALVEPGVVSDEQRVSGERQEARKHLRGRRRGPELALAEARQAGDDIGKLNLRIHKRLKRVDELERAHANGADLADLTACR